MRVDKYFSTSHRLVKIRISSLKSSQEEVPGNFEIHDEMLAKDLARSSGRVKVIE